jgi:hypothetical protein
VFLINMLIQQVFRSTASFTLGTDKKFTISGSLAVTVYVRFGQFLSPQY